MAAPSTDGGAGGGAPTEEDRAEGRALLRGGSRSFQLASFLLPAGVRESATALYAFCRLADDAIDGQVEGREAVGGQRDASANGTGIGEVGGVGAAGLAALRGQLDRVYAGAPRDPVERLLAEAVGRHGVPRELLDALLEGFEWDLAGRQYANLGELRAYAVRVAGTVGATMTLMMGVRSEPVLARACELGIAMQLTNIARDVGQDARAGRLYLPHDWLREAGIDPPAWLARPAFTPELAGVIERLLRAADGLYASASAGIAHLPRQARAGVHAARLLYSGIGQELRRMGLDALAARARVGRVRQLALLLNAVGAALRGAGELATPAPPEARFLLEAVRRSPAPAGARPVEGAEPRLGRAEWVLELFARIEERERAGA